MYRAKFTATTATFSGDTVFGTAAFAGLTVFAIGLALYGLKRLIEESAVRPTTSIMSASPPHDSEAELRRDAERAVLSLRPAYVPEFAPGIPLFGFRAPYMPQIQSASPFSR